VISNVLYNTVLCIAGVFAFIQCFVNELCIIFALFIYNVVLRPPTVTKTVWKIKVVFLEHMIFS